MSNKQTQSPPGSSTIAPGAQEYFLPGGPTGVLVIHGYGGSIGDYRKFSEALHNHGYAVLGMRLAGHGQSLEALRATGSADWQASVMAAAQRLRQSCPNIIVVGSSFGAALALNYAREMPNHLSAVVVVNPAVRYRAGGTLQTVALKLLRLVTKDYRKPGITAAEAERYRELGSMTHWPIDGIFETYHFIQHHVVPFLPAIQTPTLVMAINDDPIVHSDSARIIHGQIGAKKKKLVWLPGKTHRPFRDKELITRMVQEIITFVRE